MDTSGQLAVTEVEHLPALETSLLSVSLVHECNLRDTSVFHSRLLNLFMAWPLQFHYPKRHKAVLGVPVQGTVM